jgi:hypothetical protein
MERDDTWKTKTLVTGAVLGALTGIGAAYLLTRRAEQEGRALAITSGQGLKLGVMIIGLLRSILTLGDD